MKKFTILFSFLLCFILFFSVSTYASEDNLPELPKPNEMPFVDYVIYKDHNNRTSLILFTSDNALSMSAFRLGTGNYISFISNSNYNYYIYHLTDNNWVLKTSDINMKSKNVDMSGIYYSNIDIYNTDKVTIFFPKTPLVTQQTPTLAEMLEVEIPATANKIIQAMKIILLCGVGCLAFLVCLVILPKVLYRFL